MVVKTIFQFPTGLTNVL
jgi:hypothetical protein